MLITSVGLDNPVHILLLTVVLLLVFGAKRLPDIGRSLGEGMRGFKESLSGDPQRETIAPSRAAAPLATSLNVAPSEAEPEVHAS